MRGRSLVLMVATIAIGVAAGLVAISAAGESDPAAKKRDAGFKPKSIKGKWTGVWDNNTFGSDGDILANVKFKDGKLIPLVDFSGDVLGCPDPPADTITLKSGKGADKYNENGFKIKEESAAFGDDFKFTYKEGTNEVTATGSSPCTPGLTFKMTGTLTESSFSGSVEIESDPPSTADLSASED